MTPAGISTSTLSIKTPSSPRTLRSLRPVRTVALLAGAAGLVLTISGCGGAAAAGGDSTFVFATGKDISCLDPHVNGDMPQASIAANYLDSLVSQDSEGAIHPWLASGLRKVRPEPLDLLVSQPELSRHAALQSRAA